MGVIRMVMNNKSQVEPSIIIAVVIAITLIEITALCNGIDGTLMMVIVAVLAAIGGIAIPSDLIINLKGGAKNG